MPNHLANETSPYLLQHANNPVDWYPWGEEALKLARNQNKPILLSIGYSACHWCHVMAHESFEDPETAAIMNRHFVNIKVDREERPDIDQIYQTAQHLLTERNGGWPLTMFLMPDQTPFYGGTYFPKTARYNLPAFTNLLEQVAEAYQSKQKEIAVQNEAILERLDRITANHLPEINTPLSNIPLENAASAFNSAFDVIHGGIGDAPKFPHSTELEFCLRRYAVNGEKNLHHIGIFSLEKMALGGIFDQLGGGFCRYSVDRYWAIPHFEKMLYDNGPLLRLYADAWTITQASLFKKIVGETAAWVMREMQSPEGGYYSSYDADSEGEEGKFYVWERGQVSTLLTKEEFSVVEPYFGLDRAPNFEHYFWHFAVSQELDTIAERKNKPLTECQALLESARKKLFSERAKRVMPGRDDKVLVSWNALMIKGMARAAQIFDNCEWLKSAQHALDFIRSQMTDIDSSGKLRLFATYKDGRAHLNAYLDDYAFLLDALIELMQAEFRLSDFEFARQLADALIARFEDNKFGGFFFTSHDHEKLLVRPKPSFDSAIPSGNGVAAFSLQRLGHITGEPSYLISAERVLNLFFRNLMDQAGGYSSLCFALEEALTPPRIIVIRGNEETGAAWKRALAQLYLPSTVTVFIPSDLKNLPETLDKRVGGNVNAWVCQGVTCLAPIDNLETLVDVCKEKNIG